MVFASPVAAFRLKDYVAKTLLAFYYLLLARWRVSWFCFGFLPIQRFQAASGIFRFRLL
jgi:hypothetical protein